MARSDTMKRLFVMFVAALLAAGLQTTRSAAERRARREAAGRRAAQSDDRRRPEGRHRGLQEERSPRPAAIARSRRRRCAHGGVLSEAWRRRSASDLRAPGARLSRIRKSGRRWHARALARPARSRRSQGRPVGLVGSRRRRLWHDLIRWRAFSATPTGLRGGLVLRDLAAGTNHRLTAGLAEGSTQFSAISKDGKQIAYQWRTARAGGCETIRASCCQAARHQHLGVTASVRQPGRHWHRAIRLVAGRQMDRGSGWPERLHKSDRTRERSGRFPSGAQVR